MESTKVKLKVMGIMMIAILILQIFMPIFVYGADNIAYQQSVDNIASTKYRVSNGYIIKILAGETVENLLKNISSNLGDLCTVYKGDNLSADADAISTDMTLKVGNSSYKLAVLGDTNADARVTALDLSILMKGVVSLQTLEGASFKAADMNNDEKLSAVDISRMKMLIVGLTLPDDDDIDVSGQIIINPSTTQPAKVVEVSVQWPSDLEGLTKQISVDSGKTFTSNIDRAAVTENGTVIARLVDRTSKVVKSATLQITNIDNVGPADFEAEAVHTIANYITLKGETTDVDKYYFSKNDGTTWLPNNGLVNGEYTFTDVAPNSVVPLRMKAVDEVGNETVTPTVNQRTFKAGIEILSERLKGSNIDKENSLITLPDGRSYKLITTALGSYDIIAVGTLEEATLIATEEATLNNKIAEFEADGVKTVAEITAFIVSEGIGKILDGNIISVEKPEYYNNYRILEAPDGSHTVAFVERISKAGLTGSGQDNEENAATAVREMAAEMAENKQLDIIELLNKAIEANILLEENVNKNRGMFETENGNVYLIEVIDEEFVIDLIGTAEEIEVGLVGDKILEELENGLKEIIIDWAIADGETTVELADKEDGAYKTVSGDYKRVYVDLETGLYETLSVPEPTGAKLEYTLNPAFPEMANKVELTAKATYEGGIEKIEIISEIGNILETRNYTDAKVAEMQYDVAQNAVYIIKATTTDGKVTEKQVLISHISTLLPIKVTISPESPRNTAQKSMQNGVETGPITVTLKYCEALLLENINKYQFKLPNSDEWKVASQIQLIEGIEENCTLYARYWDEENHNSIKQISIVIDNVDNTFPEDFEFETIATSHSITVKKDEIAVDEEEETVEVKDTAYDAKDGSKSGHPARKGMANIEKYEYSLDGINWQLNNTFSGLTQDTEYTVYVKAIDYAGNEKAASNNGQAVRTKIVPKASDCVTFHYDPTDLTNKAVTVTLELSNLTDLTNVVEYQILERGQDQNSLVDANWVKDAKFDVIYNCTIYTRIVDVTGQCNPDGGYKVGNVTNIDNLPPKEFTPTVTSRTKTSLTVNAIVSDAEQTNRSLASGIAGYTYYLIPSSGNTIKVENTSSICTFKNLTPGRAYSIYVEAKDGAGNLRVSEQITTGTNAEPGKITEITTTIRGIMESASHDNPVIPAGFKPVNTTDADWGTDSLESKSQVDNGLVLEDAAGNQFVWVPVDGTKVKYEKWLTEGVSKNVTKDGENPVDETAQISKYKGYYVGRYEAGKSSADIVSKVGFLPVTGLRYDTVKERAEAMYDTASVQSGLMTGTQWDTMMKWIALGAADKEKNETINEDYVTKDLKWGNYTETKRSTGYDSNWKAKNIFDLAGNVEEITNEFTGVSKDKVVLRGGSITEKIAAGARRELDIEMVGTEIGFRTVLYVVERAEYEPSGEGILGIGNINKGPGNVTVNGLEANYRNPVVPVGFKAVNTPEAKWTGVTPTGWNHGLVIQDVNDNQFVWIPVDGNIVKYEKGTLVWQSGTYSNATIEGDEIPASVIELGDEEKTQIEDYQGFYIARYEAGNEAGSLASKAGLKPVNAVDYETAKTYAESMYNTLYVKSGLPTGTAWDAMTQWIENQKGTVYVTKDVTTGNSYYNTFTFSGLYAIGPNTIDEIRGEYKNEPNVVKPAKQSYLLGTGQLKSASVNNIFDLAGNVWEYTTEYYTFQGKKVYIARGSDYYRKENKTWGIKIREAITTPPGEARNESGFRPMLYLAEGKAEVGVFEDFHRTMNGKPSTYNNPIIPAGFAAVNKGADWGNGTAQKPADWNNGLVIEDMAGNQFVWVPVDKTNVNYEKWTTKGILYSDTDGDIVPGTIKEWGEKERTQVLKYGGFYVARYEISKGENNEAKSVPNVESWMNITWEQAREKAEEMIQKSSVVTGLITGTQWDTIMRWVANEKGVEAVEEDSTSWGNYANSSLGRNAQAKNIYEMAGGAWEWTAEYQMNDKVFRGGVSSDRGTSAPAAYRDTYRGANLDDATGFRTVLYITGEVVGIAKKAVQEGERLYGTQFPSAVNAPVLASGMTPVKYSGETWVDTTVDDPEWYEYSNLELNGKNTSRWANARTPDGTMFVWVPRYAYKITYVDPAKVSSGGKIDVVFLNGTTNQPNEDVKVYAERNIANNILPSNNYIVHPAFRNNPAIGGWDKELPGIWVAKYERGASYDRQGAAQYYESRAIQLGLTAVEKAKIDTHMAKNTEWGAAGYLQVSKYGSGISTTNPGALSTTTGNVYGIYHMTNGYMEYTTAYMSRRQPSRTSNIYDILGAPLKYKQVYDNASSYYGDAYGETAGWNGSNSQTSLSYKWDHATPRPLFVRGVDGHWNFGAKSVFSTTVQCGNTNFAYSYRLILISEDKI